MKIVSKFHIHILNCFREVSRERALRPGRFIILNDFASSKMIIKYYFSFFRFFLRDLELFEYRRGDPYMTANSTYAVECNFCTCS